MKPTKRGICVDNELASWVYTLAKAAKISENKVYVRLLEIAREDLAPFDDAGLRRILTSAWQAIAKLPALRRQLERRSHSRLLSPTATRLTISEKSALKELARKNKTTMSAIQRDVLQRILAAEAS